MSFHFDHWEIANSVKKVSKRHHVKYDTKCNVILRSSFTFAKPIAGLICSYANIAAFACDS